MKKTLVIIVLLFGLVAAGGLTYFFLHKKAPLPVPETPKTLTPKTEIIGRSVEGRKIEAFTYSAPAGAGAPAGTAAGTPVGKNLLFVGGMHGGYEWNSVLLAYQFMDYLAAHPEFVPAGLSVTVIPSINPDGVFKVIGKAGRFASADAPSAEATAKLPAGTGRFNAHDVDLNRNFDCNWQPKSTWRSKDVSAGTAPFSEPEAAALRDFILKTKPVAAVFWHSQANAVYGSECNAGILPGTLDIMTAYATAADYPAIPKFASYAVSGDSEGWLASINIPAITVELKTHETIEWDKNLAGVKAVIEYFSNN